MHEPQLDRSTKNKKIWIDLDNSPHVPFFVPIIRELENKGYGLLITARRCFQVCGLADRFNLEYKVIGRHHGKIKVVKGLGLVFRAIQLLPVVLRKKPILAISHGSRAQLIAANILRIPSIIIFDYEFSKGIPFIKPTWKIGPEVIPDSTVGLKKDCVFRYPGIKEDAYIPWFTPDAKIVEELGLNFEKIVITIRPPATEAHYFKPESEQLFEMVMDFLAGVENTQLVLVPRNEKQEQFIRQKWPLLCSNEKVVIPDHVVDGLNLIWHSDLVISGGGTMNREAAALGVPVYSIFRGKIGAVDRYLSEKGRLILIENKAQLYSKIVLARRNKSFNPANSNNLVLQEIVSHIVNIIEGQYA